MIESLKESARDQVDDPFALVKDDLANTQDFAVNNIVSKPL